MWGQNNAVSADGSRAFFWTNEQLTSDDNNTVSDVYERSGGTTTLVSVAETPFTGGF